MYPRQASNLLCSIETSDHLASTGKVGVVGVCPRHRFTPRIVGVPPTPLYIQASCVPAPGILHLNDLACSSLYSFKWTVGFTALKRQRH